MLQESLWTTLGSTPVRRELCSCLSTPLRSPRISHLWVRDLWGVFLCVTRSNPYYTPEMGVSLISAVVALRASSEMDGLCLHPPEEDSGIIGAGQAPVPNKFERHGLGGLPSFQRSLLQVWKVFPLNRQEAADMGP
ncbi:hypothetical protein SKAU_G00189920 [Synaphobranchus kaupii]|uniref:Uncharacterized protein n=1 Tax=Synaphobranchus kaupii TaxID=118154 RepID=A0A9Q1IX67_SYNKA|nr:hypothetical protein SKAU_G00189920 [Synaphobranchus kaupii]